MIDTKKNIKSIQTVLQDAGLYKGAIDGIAGENTVLAVKSAAAPCLPTENAPVFPDINAPITPDANAPALPPVSTPVKPPAKKGDVTDNFNMAELVFSNNAEKYKLNNTPSNAHKQNLIAATVNLFQPIRDILGQPMNISSGYRSKAVNDKVGGSATSAHSFGYAIDFVAPKFGSTTDIVKFLAKELIARNIKFDQMILEFPNTANSWVHIGYKNGAGKQRGEIKTASRVKGKTVYTMGIHG